jgi:hypothetical protein
MFGIYRRRKAERNQPQSTGAKSAGKSAATDNRPLFEMLESRTLMSASGEVMQPDIVYADTSSNASDIQGYTPAQIDKAYGFDSISLSNGVTADGAGQTIAIVDAYNDPKIAADTAVFDSEFDLPAINLKVVSQTGSTSSLPASNAGWAGEISLDVEWAHAIAPGATILLVEANSDNTDDLMTAVNYARNAAGVSVVSMSWGGSEFFDWGNGGESDSQLTYDADFTTPAGHQGVTFIAAAGDSGAQSGVQWPASSPNVVSVGGTTLYTSDSTGTYDAEVGWTGTIRMRCRTAANGPSRMSPTMLIPTPASRFTTRWRTKVKAAGRKSAGPAPVPRNGPHWWRSPTRAEPPTISIRLMEQRRPCPRFTVCTARPEPPITRPTQLISMT